MHSSSYFLCTLVRFQLLHRHRRLLLPPISVDLCAALFISFILFHFISLDNESGSFDSICFFFVQVCVICWNSLKSLSIFHSHIFFSVRCLFWIRFNHHRRCSYCGFLFKLQSTERKKQKKHQVCMTCSVGNQRLLHLQPRRTTKNCKITQRISVFLFAFKDEQWISNGNNNNAIDRKYVDARVHVDKRVNRIKIFDCGYFDEIFRFYCLFA